MVHRRPCHCRHRRPRQFPSPPRRLRPRRKQPERHPPMPLSRRTIIGAPLAAALIRCGAEALTPAQIVTEAGIAAKGLSGALTQIAEADPHLIPATTAATLQNDLTLAQGAAS